VEGVIAPSCGKHGSMSLYYTCLTDFSRILMKQEMMGGSGISWTICKPFAPRSRQITMPANHHLNFYRPDAVPDTQPTVSKH